MQLILQFYSSAPLFPTSLTPFNRHRSCAHMRKLRDIGMRNELCRCHRHAMHTGLLRHDQMLHDGFLLQGHMYVTAEVFECMRLKSFVCAELECFVCHVCWLDARLRVHTQLCQFS